MRKTYQIKFIDEKGQAQTIAIEAGPAKEPTTLTARAGSRYTLEDMQQGTAPDTIRVLRKGKNLLVYFDGAVQPELSLENFFEHPPVQTPSLTGISENGALYEYRPETGLEPDRLTNLSDHRTALGMALGGPELPTTTGAAVGLLAPAAGGGLGLGAAGAGALGAAALGGGGANAIKPIVSSAALAATSDSGPLGDNITNQQKPQFVGKASPGALIEIVLNGSIRYSTTADPVSGDFRIDVPTDLNPGQYKMQVTASLNGVSSDTFQASSFVVDISHGENFDASGKTITDVNSLSHMTTLTLSDDSGKSNDLKTSNPQQKFTGTVDGFNTNGDQVLVTLTKSGDPSFQLSEYLTPNAQNQWTWDQSARTLAPGHYVLKALLVDGAGNEVDNSAGPVTRTDNITITPGNGKIISPDGTVVADPNSTDKASVMINRLVNDTGTNSHDFVTNDNTLKFEGTLQHFTHNGDMVKLVLKNSTGALTHSDFITPVGNTWAWDLSTLKLSDGRYELMASLVDAAGQEVLGTSGQTQKLAIDTDALANHNETASADDANKTLVLSAMSMTDSWDGQQANTQLDKITNSATPELSGNFGAGKTWTSNDDILRIQVHNLQSGEVTDLSPPTLTGNNSWTSTAWKTPLVQDGLYIAKACIMDAAGNVLSTRQQTFALDKTAPSLAFSETVKDLVLEGTAFSNGLTVSKFALASNEAVRYEIKSGSTVLAQGQYSGTAMATEGILNGNFDAGNFTVTYTDAAGNTSSYTNALKLIFDNTIIHTSAPSHGYSQSPTPAGISGQVGSLTLSQLEPSLDLTSVVADGQLHSYINMSASGAQNLTLNLNDVLSMGVVNAYRANGLLQLRVDGDSSDSLIFKDRSAWETSTSPVSMDNGHYALYTSHDLQGGLVEVLVQQGIQIS
jgi:hypothetical protein